MSDKRARPLAEVWAQRKQGLISIQVAKIADARGCPPGHVNYLKKDDMADIAAMVLPELCALEELKRSIDAGIEYYDELLEEGP